MSRINSRTILNFAYSGDLWAVVDGWSRETKFKLVESSQTHRLYTKSSALHNPIMVEVGLRDGETYIMAWAKNITSAFLPAEMELGSGGVAGLIPRTIGRKAVNKLLERLGQSPIS